jgi:hypothetical protein
MDNTRLIDLAMKAFALGYAKAMNWRINNWEFVCVLVVV